MRPEPAATFTPPPGQEATRTNVQTARHLAAGARLAGRYRIVGLVGIGGMGLVYRAEDEQLGLPVAIKLLRPELAGDERWLQRFKQELVLARQVSHPNVVRTHDLGSDGDLVFLTMDFVAGRSLRDLLAESGPLPPERAIAIARQLASGLAAAHEAGVVHRDLKPGNVLVDDSWRASISDFGVARSLAGSGLTLPGTVVGTLAYLSPEQARGDDVDGRSDLYALGLLLFEMLTRELPFAGGSDVEVLAQRLTGTARDLSATGIKVAPPLAAVVRRLLERDPARRYQTARDVVADLDRSAPESRRTGALRSERIAGAILAAFAVALLALGGLVAYRRGGLGPKPAAAVAPAPRHTVALLPLADETGRADLAWVASGLPEMLTASLAESSGLRVLDGERVFRTLGSLKLAPGPLGDPDARRLAELLDADRLVSGRVRSAGNRLRIDLALVAADVPGTPARSLHAEAAPGEVFRLIARLGAMLREQLAAPASGAAPQVSRKPAALAAYAQGVASLRRGDSQTAAAALERAVAADPGYCAAWVRLARARESLGQSEEAHTAARRAVESLEPGESRTAYEAQAVEARLSGRPEKGQEILARLVARYPGDLEARIDLAEAYGEQGRLDRAISALQTAVAAAPHHPRAWFLLAKYSILAGNARRAADEYLVRALVVQNQLGSDEGRADVLNAFGVAYRDLGEMDRAEESYAQAAAIRQRIGDDRGFATTLRNLAALHTMRGEYAEAERKLETALRLLGRLGDAAGIADLENDFGVLAEERGNYEEALGHYQRALRSRRDLGNDLALAQSFGNVGYAQYLLGRYDDALVYWRQGRELAEKSGDPSGVALATQNLGLLELARGDWNQAAASFLSALKTGRELGMKESIAASLGQLGRLAEVQGRPAAALASYAEALSVLREIDDRRGLAEFTLAQAEVELELGRADAAGRRLQAAADLLGTSDNREQQAELERLRGERHLLRGEPTEARAALRRAVAHAEASHGVVELLEARVSAAEAEHAAGRNRAALAALARLREEAEALGHARLRLRAALGLARAELAAGDPGRAREVAQAGLDLASRSGGWAGAYRLHLLLARALASAGHGDEARAERESAAAEVARVGRDLEPAERTAFQKFTETSEP